MEEEKAVKFTLLALPIDVVCDLLSIGVRIQGPELFTLFTTIYVLLYVISKTFLVVYQNFQGKNRIVYDVYVIID